METSNYRHGLLFITYSGVQTSKYEVKHLTKTINLWLATLNPLCFESQRAANEFDTRALSFKLYLGAPSDTPWRYRLPLCVPLPAERHADADAVYEKTVPHMTEATP